MADSDRKERRGVLPLMTTQGSVLHWLTNAQLQTFTPESLELLASVDVKSFGGPFAKTRSSMFNPITGNIRTSQEFFNFQGNLDALVPQDQDLVSNSMFHEAVHALDKHFNEDPSNIMGETGKGLRWFFKGSQQSTLPDEYASQERDFKEAYSGDPDYSRMGFMGLPPQEWMAIAGLGVGQEGQEERKNVWDPKMSSHFDKIFQTNAMDPSLVPNPAPVRTPTKTTGGLAVTSLLPDSREAFVQENQRKQHQRSRLIGIQRDIRPHGSSARIYNQRKLRSRVQEQ